MEVKTFGLALLLVLMAAPLFIFWRTRVKLAGALGLAALRMVVQLSLIGLVLSFLFRVEHPAATGGWLVVMVIAGTHTVINRLKLPWKFLLPVVVFPLFIASTTVMAFLTLAVVKPDMAAKIPLFNPRFMIPVFGMMLGNSMNAMALALDRFGGDLRSNWRRYYADIAMGARVREAAAPYMRSAIRASMAPRVMNMASTGIIFLPGMMTGLIVQGADPTSAIKYQIMVLLGIFIAESLALWGALYLYIGRLFDAYYLPAPFILRRDEE